MTGTLVSLFWLLAAAQQLTTGPPPPAGMEPDPVVVASRVNDFYAKTPLNGIVCLSRWWVDKERGGFGSRYYEARVAMSALRSQVEVYEPDSANPSEPVARIIVTAGSEPLVFKRNELVDSCLFGSLKQIWLGESGEPPSFVDWILEGQSAGACDFLGHRCLRFDRIVEEREAEGETEAEGGYYRRVDTIWVDQNGWYVVAWRTMAFDKPDGAPSMICLRSYHWH